MERTVLKHAVKALAHQKHLILGAVQNGQLLKRSEERRTSKSQKLLMRRMSLSSFLSYDFEKGGLCFPFKWSLKKIKEKTVADAKASSKVVVWNRMCIIIRLLRQWPVRQETDLSEMHSSVRNYLHITIRGHLDQWSKMLNTVGIDDPSAKQWWPNEHKHGGFFQKENDVMCPLKENTDWEKERAITSSD